MSIPRKLQLGLLIISLAVFASIWPAGAAAVPPEPTPLDLKLAAYGQGPLSDLPRLTAAQPAEAAAAPSSVEGNPSWGRVAYQAYTGGNYEIMLARADLSQRVRLTAQERSDVEPRLNRGATQVIFASNRTGNYDIHRMGVDGSNLFQLTTDSRHDRMPAWSGDGGRIVFASERDGNYEIYVMAGDGSGQSRRTFDGAPDVSPTWSPDDARIAWARQNGAAAAALWVMNADGTNPHPITPDLPLLENPVWSPDGRQIGFDYDANGDGWTDIAVINADGTGSRVVATTNSAGYSLNDDLWMGAWSPNGSALMATRVSYVVYQGQLYIDVTRLDEYALSGIFLQSYSVPDYPMMPDWQSEDLSAPATSVAPLPAYSRAFGAAVRWAGADVGPAGLAGYSVQVRTGAGEWTDWQTRTLATSAVFSGTAGSTVYFRSRGVDDAGNVEPWPAGNGDAWTTFFTWNVAGALSDNRGRPLPGGEITLTPAALARMTTGPDGAFGGRLTGSGAHTLGVVRPGYAPLSGETIDISADRRFDLTLGPLDNAVTNGGFESTDPLSGWTRTGSLSAATSGRLAATGARSALLEAACAFPCLERAEPFPPDPSYTFLAVADPTGTVHMISGIHTLRYRTRSPQGAWSAAATWYEGESAMIQAMTEADNGTIHAIFSGPGGLWHREKPLGGDWTAAVSIGTDGSGVDLAADRAGGLHIVMQQHSYSNQHNIWYVERLPSGEWLAPQPMDKDEGYSLPGIATGPDNSVHIIWQEVSRGVFYRSRAAGAAWTASELIFAGSGYSYDRQHLLIGPEGEAHAIWNWPYQEYHAVRLPQGGWSAPEEIEGWTHSAQADIDSAGAIHVVTTSGAVTQEGTYYLRKLPGQPWSTRARLETDYNTTPAISVDSSSAVHIVTGARPEFHYFTTQRMTAAANGALSQSLAIPATAHRPTLAFRYRLLGLRADSRSNAVARIAAGPAVMEVALPAAGGATAFKWADVTAFAGKTVTVSFDVAQAAGESPVRLQIDDVSLGSWLTPVIAAVTPAQADAGAAFTLTVTGDNFIRAGDTPPQVRIGDTLATAVTWVDEKTLTVAAPALKPGHYTVRVVNPGGQEAARSGALAVGRQGYLPLLGR